MVHGPEDLIVDLALEAPPSMPATVSILGPTFAPDELAGRKLLALFDRAAARDFADVFQLSERPPMRLRCDSGPAWRTLWWLSASRPVPTGLCCVTPALDAPNGKHRIQLRLHRVDLARLRCTFVVWDKRVSAILDR